MKRACEHCGVNFSPRVADESYCCSGCMAVAALLASEGLEEFYRRRDAPGRPVGSLPQVDRAWAGAIQKEAEAVAQNKNAVALKLAVEGMTCGGCVWLIEHLFNREETGDQIAVSLSGGSMDLKWSEGQAFNLAGFLEALAAHGYRVKSYRGSWLSGVPLTVRYFGLAGLFSFNAILLLWLKRSDEAGPFADTTLRWLLNGLLVFSVFASVFCCLLWVWQWRVSARGKATPLQD
ncbi:MAG: hypothetical protein GWO81_05530 [Verrucomicrobia bacterium]|nr:hypothetical protein [Verrucomicrobiota bacterium]